MSQGIVAETASIGSVTKQTDRHSKKPQPSGFFALVCLIKFGLCVRTHFFTHSTNKYCSTPEGGWLSEVPLERWLRRGVAGGSYGIRPNTGKSIPSYCKWSNYITVNLTLTFSATSASALRLHLCNCGKLSTNQKIPAACHVVCRRLVCERGWGRETSVQETESGTFSKGHEYTNLCIKLHCGPITTAKKMSSLRKICCCLQWDKSHLDK